MKTKTYYTWQSAKQRCINPRNKCYDLYGGRGISMCDRWLNSYKNFLEDMGEKPNGKTLDRIDNNGNYEPNNCRYVSHRENCRNRSDTKLNPYDAELIRGLSKAGISQRKIGRMFDISKGHVWRVKEGIAWILLFFIITSCSPKIDVKQTHPPRYEIKRNWK